MNDSITPDLFRTRFAVAPFSDGGIVVDTLTGNYSRLNVSATVMCVALEQVDSLEGAIAVASEKLRIPQSVARSGMESLVSALLAKGIRHEPPDPFRYRVAEAGGYDLWHDQTLVLHVDDGGRCLKLVTPVTQLALRVYDYVSAIAPKVLFLRGVTVLHGSSCVRDGSLIGICGKSRAGKTTTGRILARYTSGLVSEDLLVLGSDLSKPEAFVEGEATVHRWSVEASQTLTETGEVPIDDSHLTRASSGQTVPLRTVWFLDARRRKAEFAARRLAGPDALALLIANHFLGAADSTNWRRHLTASHLIASSVDSYEIDVPDGLERLDQAIGRYTTNSAS
jgi:hypothetical protein